MDNNNNRERKSKVSFFFGDAELVNEKKPRFSLGKQQQQQKQ